MADNTEEEVAGTKAVRPIYREKFATSGMLFEFAKKAWLQPLNKMLRYFEFPSIGAQDALLKQSSSPVASVVDEVQAPPAVATVVGDVKDGDDWNLTGAVVLDSLDWVGSKCHFRDFWNSFFAKKRKVSGTIAESFDFSYRYG